MPVSQGYIQLIQIHCLLMDANLKDRDASCLSFFIHGANLVQIEHYGMEIMDNMDITEPHFTERNLLDEGHDCILISLGPLLHRRGRRFESCSAHCRKAAPCLR